MMINQSRHGTSPSRISPNLGVDLPGKSRRGTNLLGKSRWSGSLLLTGMKSLGLNLPGKSHRRGTNLLGKSRWSGSLLTGMKHQNGRHQGGASPLLIGIGRATAAHHRLRASLVRAARASLERADQRVAAALLLLAIHHGGDMMAIRAVGLQPPTGNLGKSHHGEVVAVVVRQENLERAEVEEEQEIFEV